MRGPSELDLLSHIEEQIGLIRQFIGENNMSILVENIMVRAAVERCFAIIGEASSRLSAQLTDRYPQVPWRAVKTFRNFIVHEYFGVDYIAMWNTVQDDLPVLLTTVQQMIAEYSLRHGKSRLTCR